MIEYSLKLPLQNVNFDDATLTFSINHLRSRRPSVLYFILHLYDSTCQKVVDEHTGEVSYTGEVLNSGNPVYTSPRTVVGTKYTPDGNDYVQKIELDESLLSQGVYYLIELVTLGVDSENPLYFSELMLEEGENHDGYHTPSELTPSHRIDLQNNPYANLYTKDGTYLQVIRPNLNDFSTDKLDGAEYTVLAPHFDDEPDVDGHVAVFLECMNQTEQTIDVLR